MRAIIFDFDGVIVNSEPLHEAALRVAVGELGMSLPHERYAEDYVGYDDRDCFRVIARDHGRTLSAAELESLAVAKRRAIEVVLRDGRATAWPGAVELIRAAQVHGPTAVCSGARLHEVKPVLEQLRVRECFSAIVTADDVERSKPDPACYVLTAKRLGVDPRDCVAIEDTPTGASAARAAGMKVATVCQTMKAAALVEVSHRVFASMKDITVAALSDL